MRKLLLCLLALCLLAVFAGYIYLLTRQAKKARREEENSFGVQMSKGKCAALILIGVIIWIQRGIQKDLQEK